MTLPDPFLDLDALRILEEAHEGLAVIHEETAAKLRAIRAGDDDPNEPPAGALTPPADFTATYDDETRRVTSRWTPQDDAVERHERLRPPTNTTLRSTISGDVGISTSSQLAPGPSEWALRSLRGDQVSAFTDWIAIDIPAADDGQDDGQDDGDDQGDDDTPPGQNGPTPLDIIPALRTWTLTLPTGAAGDPDNDYPADWGNLPDVFFVRDNAVVMRCVADGTHTENSDYPRDELRQMADDQWTKAAWPSSGNHTCTADLAIDTRGLTVRPRMSAMQIHDGGDDVMQLIYERGIGLGVSHNDGDDWELLWRDYQDAQRFLCMIAAVDDRISVYLDGNRALDIPKKGSGWYFKVGPYLQTGGASEHHEPAGAYGEVILYSLVTTGGAS